ncbi:MAG: response regulator [Halioglobus sp.]
MRFKTITAKLLAVYLPLVLVSLGILLAAMEVDFYYQQRAELAEELQQIVDIQSKSLAPAMWEYDTDRLGEVAREIGGLPHVQSFQIRDLDAKVLVESGDSHLPVELAEYRVTRDVIYSNGTVLEKLGTLTISGNSDFIWVEVRTHIQSGLMSFLVLLLALTGATLLANRLVIGRPVELLHSSIRLARSKGEYQKVDWAGNDELADVVHAYNDLLDSQAEAEQEINRYQKELEQRVEERTAELREQKEIVQLTMDNIVQGILFVDENARIASYNAQWLDMLEMSEVDVARHANYEDLTRHIYAEKLGQPEAIEQVLADAQSQQSRVSEVILADGTVIEVHQTPISGGGFVRTYTDISLQKMAAQQLELAKEVAEDSARSKSAFLANMSHEIRTPMNAIIGMSELALKTELNPKQYNYIDKVNRSAVSLLGIINDILDFSKIEAGKLDLESIDFHLEDVLDNLVNLVGLKAEEKGLELLLDIDQGVPTLLKGDPLRLSQVLVNLGNNAVKFTDSGEIVISIKVLEQNAEQVSLQFSVRDSGIGMTDEQKSTLFQAFNQADASTTRKYGGTGLGLTISQSLVEMMQGEIGVHSEPGKGSEFYFSVELTYREDQADQTQENATDLEGMNVLVVDDNPTAREILKDIAKSLGFRVETAASGAKALSMVERSNSAKDPFTVVLMDWQMPAMDGVATVQELVDQNLLTSAQTVMMVTAFGREEAAAAGQDLPIANYLTKPVNASTLHDSILAAHGLPSRMSQRRRMRQEDTEIAAKLAGANILLVEDNDINQELALEILTNAGMRVDVANNGQEALDRLAIKVYDGVLMDIQMPVMDGYTATARIREQAQFHDLPVIAMTANAMVGDREKAMEAGMNDHIAKPLNVTDMFNTMARWIEVGAGSVTNHSKSSTPKSPDVPIPELPGIDSVTGLARVEGNSALYRKLLGKFYVGYRDFEKDFRVAQNDDDSTSAMRLAHTLRGVAASIGANDIETAALDLESACADGAQAQVEPSLLSVIEALAPVLDGLSGLVGADNSPETTGSTREINRHEMQPLVTQLSSLLSASDTSAVVVGEQLAAVLADTELAPAMSSLMNAIDSYDFDTALAMLQELAGQSRG